MVADVGLSVIMLIQQEELSQNIVTPQIYQNSNAGLISLRTLKIS